MTIALAALGGCGARSPASAPAAVPVAVQQQVHRSLHRLGRVCPAGRTRQDRVVAGLTARLIDLHRRFAPGRYVLRIDGESGSMLSVLLIVRDAVRRCDAASARAIDRVLPARVRSALTPLPAPGRP